MTGAEPRQSAHRHERVSPGPAQVEEDECVLRFTGYDAGVQMVRFPLVTRQEGGPDGSSTLARIGVNGDDQIATVKEIYHP
jgi:hypothetical protein